MQIIVPEDAKYLFRIVRIFRLWNDASCSGASPSRGKSFHRQIVGVARTLKILVYFRTGYSAARANIALVPRGFHHVRTRKRLAHRHYILNWRMAASDPRHKCCGVLIAVGRQVAREYHFSVADVVNAK
jgi:hypothetical protein